MRERQNLATDFSCSLSIFRLFPPPGPKGDMNTMDIYFYAPSEDARRAAKRSQRGSFEYACGDPATNRIWPDWNSFELWLADEVERDGVQFRNRTRETGVWYEERFELVCRRQMTGGPKKYKRKTDKKIKESCKVCFSLSHIWN
jgi:hypothetical protein